MESLTQLTSQNHKATHVENPMKQNCWNGANAQTRQTTPENADVSLPDPQAKQRNNRTPLPKFSQDTKVAAPTRRGNSRREGVHH